MNESMQKSLCFAVVFVVDFFQAGSSQVNALKPDFRGGAEQCGEGRFGNGAG